MRFLSLTILLPFIYLLFVGGKPTTNNPTTREIIFTMLDSIKKIKTQRFDLKSMERVNGEYLTAESKIKINENPKKIYFRGPQKGIELLWVDGLNNNQVIVYSKSMPLMNLNLDPYGNMMRKDQHHTIFDLGMARIGITVANTIIAAPKDFDKHFKYAGIVRWDNKDCYQIIIDYPDYKYIEHITQKGESVTSIALKYSTSDFKIREVNDLSSLYGKIKAGKKIKVPIPYASKALFYIEKKTMLPINLKIFDEKGLYESYEYTNLIINQPFAVNEFSKNFHGYWFK